MTWVIAASTVYGYGCLYSDVQVTFRDGNTRDVVQKAYPIANSIAAGFAGSVKIGFMEIQSLTDHLLALSGNDGTYLWDPVLAARSWAPVAQTVFNAAERSEQRLGCRLLLVGASPTERRGLGAKIYFIRFSSPEFQPQIMSQPIKMCGIGTGAAVLEYKHSIKPLFRLTSGLLKAEIGNPGGWGNHLGHSISRKIGGSPRAGISRHLNIILIAKEGFRFGTTDQVDHNRDGSRTEYKMPMLARSYGEFLKMSAAVGSDGAGAVC